MKRTGDRPPIPVQPAVVPGVESSEAGHRVVERAVPGFGYHQDKYKESPDSYRLDWDFVCSCGWFMAGQMCKDGSVSRRVRVAWEGHLDSVRNEGLIINMGVIHKARSTETVVVMTSQLAVQLGFDTKSRWKEYTLQNPWLCVTTTDTKNTSTQRVKWGYFEREAAVNSAREYLRRMAETFKVDLVEEATPQISVQEETSRLIEAADRAIETGEFRDIAMAWEQFETFDRLLPIIRQKRDKVEFLKNSLAHRATADQKQQALARVKQ
jgi:hypothetical protein